MSGDQRARSYAEELKALRKLTGETQAKLAKRLGIPRRTLEGYERGKPPRVLAYITAIKRELAKHGIGQ